MHLRTRTFSDIFGHLGHETHENGRSPSSNTAEQAWAPRHRVHTMRPSVFPRKYWQIRTETTRSDIQLIEPGKAPPGTFDGEKLLKDATPDRIDSHPLSLERERVRVRVGRGSRSRGVF